MKTPNQHSQRRVFLSLPISDNLASNGTFRSERRVFYEGVHAALDELGIEVESAALNEDWGRIKLRPLEFTVYDLEAIERSDILVVVTSERLTSDMYLEVGLALGWGKPVFFFVPASARVTFMLEGLAELHQVKITRYDAEADVPVLIRNSLPESLV